MGIVCVHWVADHLVNLKLVMKTKIVSLLIIILLVGCGDRPPQPNVKCAYSNGDVVYHKVDNVQIVVTDVWSSCTYNGRYLGDDGEFEHIVFEEYEVRSDTTIQ